MDHTEVATARSSHGGGGDPRRPDRSGGATGAAHRGGLVHRPGGRGRRPPGGPLRTSGGGRGRSGPPTHGARPGHAAVAAAVLMAVPAVRAAVWLDLICVVAAVILGSYALVGGSTGRQLARAAMALIPGVVRGFAWFATARTADSGEARTGRRRTGRTVVAIGIGFALLAVFGSLFRASDATFAALTDDWLLHATPANWARAAVGFLVVGAAAVGTSHLARYPVTVADPTAPRARPPATGAARVGDPVGHAGRAVRGLRLGAVHGAVRCGRGRAGTGRTELRRVRP